MVKLGVKKVKRLIIWNGGSIHLGRTRVVKLFNPFKCTCRRMLFTVVSDKNQYIVQVDMIYKEESVDDPQAADCICGYPFCTGFIWIDQFAIINVYFQKHEWCITFVESLGVGLLRFSSIILLFAQQIEVPRSFSRSRNSHVNRKK